MTPLHLSSPPLRQSLNRFELSDSLTFRKNAMPDWLVNNMITVIGIGHVENAIFGDNLGNANVDSLG